MNVDEITCFRYTNLLDMCPCNYSVENIDLQSKHSTLPDTEHATDTVPVMPEAIQTSEQVHNKSVDVLLTVKRKGNEDRGTDG